MSTLLGAVPSEDPEDPPVKVCCYGDAGTGKSWLGLEIERAYIIDAERGLRNRQYQEKARTNGSAIVELSDFKSVEAEVIKLMREDHPYQTLVIDPISFIYHELVKSCGHGMPEREKNFKQDFRMADRIMWDFIHKLLLSDQFGMNVFVFAHNASLWKGGTVVSSKPDGPPKMLNMFDLLIEMFKTPRGQHRSAWVNKSRVVEFKDSETIPNFGWNTFEERFGADFLERRTRRNVELATPEQCSRFMHLFNELSPEEVATSGISKGKRGIKPKTDILEYVPEERLAAAIHHLETWKHNIPKIGEPSE